MKEIDKSDGVTPGPTVRVSHIKVKVRNKQLHQDFQTWWYVVFKGRWFISISCYNGAAHHFCRKIRFLIMILGKSFPEKSPGALPFGSFESYSHAL